MRILALFCLGALLCAGETAPPLPAGERLQSEALAFAATQAAGLPGNYTFKLLGPPVLPRNPGGEMRFEPSHISKREPTGHFFASFKASVDGRPLGMVRVDLAGDWNGKLLHARVALPRKAVPSADQLEESDFTGAPPPGAIALIPEGFRLRNAVTPGHVLVQSDLEATPVILAGDRVRLEVSDGPLTVAVETLARSNGAVGEKVRLELPTGRKVLMAVVKGPGEATTRWAGAK
jgi:flagella basal body P-ring formation protein FlgA